MGRGRPFSNRLRAFATVGSDGTALLTIDPQKAAHRSAIGSVMQRVVASVPLPPTSQVLLDSFAVASTGGFPLPDIGPQFADVITGPMTVWNATTTYVNTDMVLAPDHNIYRSNGGSPVGVPPPGGTWTVLLTYSVAANNGIVTRTGGAPTPGNSLEVSPVGIADQNIFVTIPSAGGAGLAAGAIRIPFRQVDASNYYYVEFTAGNVFIFRRLAGVETQLATVAAVIVTAAGFNIRITITGPNIAVTVWGVGAVEPTAPNLVALDTTITAAGSVGIGWGSATANGNVHFSNLIVNAIGAVAPIWDAYLGPVIPQNLVDSSVTAASRWVPTLATGQTIYRGEPLNVVARGAPIGQQVELQATLVTE